MLKLPFILTPFLLLCSALAQQQGESHIGYIYPAGARQGTTIQVTIGGRFLNPTEQICISGDGTVAGIEAKILKQERQVTPSEQKEMHEQLSKYQEKRKEGAPVTAEEVKKADDIRRELIGFGRQPVNPSLGEFITLQLTIAPNAAPGNREIRLFTPAGLSNPIVFQVGSLAEIAKDPWKNIPKSRESTNPALDPKPPEKSIKLPLTINGQIPPGGIDRYRFAATAGQSLLVQVHIRELIPFIPDAVPGYFSPVIALSDAAGREVASDDDAQIRPDPALSYKIPATGQYTLSIRDSLYRGREDFVYRITISPSTHPAPVFPLVEKTTSAHLDKLPERLEAEPNNDDATAQPVSLPIIINGRIDHPGDIDTFRIDGHAGQQLVAEVYARRLDSPLDSMLILTDSVGQQIAANDDHEDKGSGLDTHHADSYLLVTLPTTGQYFLHLSDTQHAGSPACAYRLRISAPRPDFQLRLTPSSLNVHGGFAVPLTVHALRHDGFSGPITLRLKDAQDGITLSGATIPAGQDGIRFTLNTAPTSSTRLDPFPITIEGTAAIAGREVTRTATPADDMTQAFVYRHLVPAQQALVALTGRFRPNDSARILSSTSSPLKISATAPTRIKVSIPPAPRITTVEYTLSDAPDGLAIVPSQSTLTQLTLQADPTKLKPGTRGNLIIQTFTPAPGLPADAPPAATRRLPLGTLPAIPFEVINP